MYSDEDYEISEDEGFDYFSGYECEDSLEFMLRSSKKAFAVTDVTGLRYFFEDDRSDSSGIVASLLDLSAKVAAKYYSYSYVESLYTHIPEPVAKKFMLWSFPRNPLDLARHVGEPFRGHILEGVMQIGFQVSGCCIEEGQRWDVALYIDRCIITSASCSCSSSSMPCNHVSALAFHRYMNADNIPIHLPISDSLNTMNQDQLLYLVKFIISKHSNILLRSTQVITNELLDENSEKNAQPGAPDPTAGGDSCFEPVWLKR